MSDFEEKLNAILSSPEAMAQVASLAQSLGMSSSPAGGTGEEPPGTGEAPGPSEASPPPQMPDLSALFGQADPAMLSRLLPLIQELGSGEADQRTRLLQSLRPFLRESRREKLDKAIQIARLLRVGKKFFGTPGET